MGTRRGHGGARRSSGTRSFNEGDQGDNKLGRAGRGRDAAEIIIIRATEKPADARWLREGKCAHRYHDHRHIIITVEARAN